MTEDYFTFPPSQGDGESAEPRHCERSDEANREAPRGRNDRGGLSSTPATQKAEIAAPALQARNDVENAPVIASEATKQSHLATMFLAAFLGGVLALTGAYLLISANIIRLPASSPAPTVGSTGKPLVDSSLSEPDWGALAEAVKPATVTVRATGGEQGSQGAGFIYDDRGHVVTNAHVVSGHDSFSVQLDNGFIVDATMAGMDVPTDIAVLTMTNPPSDLKPASLGNSEEVFVGQPVAAIGNPLGLSQSMTTGIVSAVNRPVSTEEGGGVGQKIVTNAIQIDAATNEGNSGGALFDGQGRVIGVTSALASDTGTEGEVKSSGIGFAIPINLVKQIADQLIEDGHAHHAWLGVNTQSVWVKAGEISQLGAQVTEVEKSSPASRAGILAKDTIIAVGDNPVISETSLLGTIHEYQPGDVVTVELVRGTQTLSLDVILTGN